MSLKSVIAFLFMASASLVGAQTLQTLVSFNGTYGVEPGAALTLGNDGNFYGTTEDGGSGGYGTVFQVTTNGTLTTLASFNGSNGRYPQAALKLGTDGNFYGTTWRGGSSDKGTVFRVTTNGTLNTLVSFNVTNGANPVAALTLGNDGNFYGTTSDNYGGGNGTVFQVTTNGALTTLVSFNGNNGATPEAALTLGTDGNFYGTTASGGSGNYGTVFKVTTNGALTTLASFTSSVNPIALTLGSDGNFYGTTDYGGIASSQFLSGMGTVFQVTTNGTLTTLVSFNGSNGAIPQAALTLDTDGNFYGTTLQGGSSGYGTLFRLQLPPLITVQPQSQTISAGATVTFFVNATSLQPLGYRWQKNGTNLFDGGNISGSTTNTLTITGISDSDVATYSVIVSNANFSITNYTTLTVIDSPIITAQPTNLLVFAGSNVAFGVSPNASAPLFYYQWQFNLNNILNATNATYTIPSVTTNNAGYYDVVITNMAGMAVSSNAALTVVLSPTSQTNFASSTATFTATAFGPELVNYQWQKNDTNIVNGGNISGAIISTLTITGISDSDAASYSVIVSDGYSALNTSNATLTVIDPPIITAQPFNLTNNAGSTATFTVQASGTDPAYQWFKGTLPISGAVLPTLTLTNVQDADMAGYTVVLTNLAGSATSAPPATLTVIDPPIITTQPLSRTNNAGSTATFTVTANGTTPYYQWFKDSLPISGAVLPTLTLTNVQDTDMAGYTVVLTNAAGSATSAPPATLTVIDLPIITAQPTNLVVLPGTNVAFGISLTGSASYFCYQWQFNGTNILNATNSVYAIASVATNNAGFYSLIVTNLAGSATSSNAALSVVLSPASRTNGASSAATFTTTAFSPELLYFQWQKNGTNLVNGGNISGATNSTLIVSSVSDSDAAIYNTVVSDATTSVTTSNAVLTVNDTLIFATQPQSQTNVIGSTITFNATAYGVPPFVFQWYFNSTPVGSPTSGTNYSSYTITNVGTNQAGIYTVKVVNGSGNVTSSNAVLTVAVTPVITTQPLSRTNSANTTATFSVAATSVLPLSYQWQQNSTNLVNGGKFSGVTNSTLNISTVSSNEAAIYSVVVTNLAGSLASSNATLTVNYPPVITTQPSAQRLVLGSGVSFNVVVSGTPPFNYQWRFNAGNLLNATNAVYVIQAIVTNNTGNYSVVITNLAGSVTSSNALLTVLVPPTMALQFLAGYPYLNLNGMLSNNFTVQYSTDLTGTNWINLLSVSNLTSSPYQFLDPAGVVPPARFYRALMQ